MRVAALPAAPVTPISRPCSFFSRQAVRKVARAPSLVVFGDGDLVEAAGAPGGGRFLLAAARPLGEPIARHGPFVMNTSVEIEEALRDLRSGHFIRDDPRDA